MLAAVLVQVLEPAWAGPVSACGTPAPVQALEAALAGAEAAWGVDEAAFRRGAEAGRAALACVAAPLDPALAARMHRVEGLVAFLERDPVRAGRAFAAAKALEPTYTFPVTMIPPHNPVRVAYDAASAADAARRAPPAARGVTVWVDGVAGGRVPADRAAIVQVQGRAGAWEANAWVLPTDPLPDYRLRGEGLRVPLLAGAGALAVGTGVVWALGAQARAGALSEEPRPRAEREALQDDTVVLGTATVALGAAATLTGASAFLFARW